MARKEFTYRGLDAEQLKKLSLKEFMTLIPSRERRSLKRGLSHEQESLLRKLEGRDGVKTHCRDLVILPQMIGKKILVHNGKEYVDVIVTEEHIGKRLGEFSYTTKRVNHNAAGVGATKGSSGPKKV
nr:30S ribosomal protein S19 [uncultured archaeon]